MKYTTQLTLVLMWLTGGAVIAQQQTFTTVGSHTFTTSHASVVELTVEAIGGGGRGGRAESGSPTGSARRGGGGGGGAYAKGRVAVSSIPYSVWVGNGGFGTNNSPSHGEASWFSDGATTLVSAEGGKSVHGNGTSTGADGGKVSNSIYNVTAYDGGQGGSSNNNDRGGGGGGAAGSAGAGGNGQSGCNCNDAGAGGSGNLLDGSSAGGGGGGGGGSNGNNGVAGLAYGGGGGGGRKSRGDNDRPGSPGASGIVVVAWSEIHSVSPASFCNSAATTVTITGAGLANVTGVELNGTALSFTPGSGTQFTAVVPAGASSGDIIVTTDRGKAKVAVAITPGLAQPSAIVGSTSLCAGAAQTYSVTNDPNATDYTWTLPSGWIGSSTTNSISVTAGSAGGTITVSANSSCGGSADQTLGVTVNPPVTPTVSIAQTSPGAYCASENITFNANVTHGGNTVYSWRVNSNPAGSGSTFSSGTLDNGDEVSLQITSDVACASSTTALSNTIAVTINPLPAAPTASAAQSFCGVPEVSQLAATGIGLQWYDVASNGTALGTNTALIDGTVYYVSQTENGCEGPRTSVVATVDPVLSASVNISASATAICAGTGVTFTASPTNGGTTPSYQWKLNGIDVGTDSDTYTGNTFSDNDTITCIMISNAAPCLTGSPAASNEITLAVTPQVTPSVTIAEVAAGVYCPGDSIAFHANVTHGGNTVYDWLVNGVSTGETGNSYSSDTLSDGAVVSLLITSDAACATNTDTVSNEIIVNINPMVTPSVSITEATSGAYCPGDTISFTSNVTHGGNTVYDWLVNGVSSGETRNSYSSDTLSSGAVVSLLITSDAACATRLDTISNAITVNIGTAIPAQPLAIAGNSSVCAGDVVTYSVPAVSAASSYTWSLPNGWTGTSTTDSINVTVGSSAGIISVTADNACGSSVAQELSVSITAVPAQPSAIVGNSSVCAGDVVTYSVPAVSGASGYTWSLPTGWTGTSTTDSISVTAGSTAGTISVIANGVCGNSVAQSQTVTITAVLAQPSNIVGPSAVCTGNTTVTYSVTNDTLATGYTWTLPTGWTGTSTTNSINVTAITTGGTISVIANGVCGNSVAQGQTITITAIPAQPSNIVGPSAVCAGNAVTYSVPNVPSANSYTWTFPAGWVSSGTGNSVTATAGTNGGTISVTANSACGSSAARTLVVSSVPSVQSTTINACAPYTLNGFTYTTSGTFRDTLQAASGCDSVVVLHVIAVDASVTLTGNTLSANENGASYLWLNCANGSFISGANQRTFTPSQSGTFAVVLNKNGCKDTSVCTSLSFVSIDEAVANVISVFPNPASDILHIKIGGVQQGMAEIRVIDMAGRTVYERNMNISDTEHVETINTDTFNSGTYHVRILLGGKSLLGWTFMIVR